MALGTLGSGTYTNALQALRTCWLTPADLGQALTVDAPQAMILMRQGKLDAFFYTVGHPSKKLKDFFKQYRRACLVPFKVDDAMRNMIPYYVDYFIWKSDYRCIKNAGSKVETFGIRCFLLTTDKVPEKVIRQVTRLFMANLKSLKKHGGPLRELEMPHQQTLRDLTWNISAPYHDGVKKLFKQMGVF